MSTATDAMQIETEPTLLGSSSQFTSNVSREDSALQNQITPVSKEPFFSVVLPTYKRRDLLSLVLDGLSNQSYSNFEVVVVVKPSNDGTEDLVNDYGGSLKIRTIVQRKGYFTEALNIGLRSARGEIIGFLDDDAIPARNWLQEHAKTYEDLGVAGVAGDVISSRIHNGKIQCLNEQLIPPFSGARTNFIRRFKQNYFDKPIPGARGYFYYITRAGEVGNEGSFADLRSRRKITPSFLGIGANMTVLRKAIRGFQFDNSWILSPRNEQVLAWYIWRKGGNLVFNPKAKVFHITHGQTLSRKHSDGEAMLFQAEIELLFYRLYKKEKSLSLTCHTFSTLIRLASTLKNKDLRQLRGIIAGNAIGIKRYILQHSLNGENALRDLEMFRRKINC